MSENERKLVTLFVISMSIVTSSFDILLNQCSPIRDETHQCLVPGRRRSHSTSENRNKRGPSSTFLTVSLSEKLSKFRVHARKFDQVTLSFYTISLIKEIATIFLSFDYLADYQLLDCFLLGRFKFLGRFSMIGSWFVISCAINFTIAKLYIVNHQEDIKFHFFEFLLHDQSYVAKMERLGLELEKKRRNAHRSTGGHVYYPKKNPPLHCWSIKCSRPKGELPLQASEYTALKVTSEQEHEYIEKLNLNFFIRNPCASDDSPIHEKWFMRPSRTVKSWKLQTKWILCCLKLEISLLLWHLIIISLIYNGQILTNLGYEIAYPACVKYLKRAQRDQVERGFDESELDYSWIYVPSKSGIYDEDYNKSQKPHEKQPVNGSKTTTLASELDIESIPSFILLNCWPQINSLFGYVRILFDSAYNYCWYSVTLAIISSLYLMIYSFTFDNVINGREIRRQMKSIVECLRIRRKQNVSCYNDGFMRHHVSDNHLVLEITRLQTLIVDHFEKVQSFSEFINGFMLLNAGLYFAQVLFISLWISSKSSHWFQTEFVLCELLFLLVGLILLTGVSITRSDNFKLYPLITSAMALDDISSLTKLRWSTIIKYYHPKPLYCFTFFKSSEISLFFILKFATWVTSGYLVMANFFFMSR